METPDILTSKAYLKGQYAYMQIQAEQIGHDEYILALNTIRFEDNQLIGKDIDSNILTREQVITQIEKYEASCDKQRLDEVYSAVTARSETHPNNQKKKNPSHQMQQLRLG